MEWNIVLLWLAGSSSVLTFFNAVRSSPRQWGWVLVSGVILSAAGIMWWWKPDFAGFVAGGLWLLFVLAPALLQRQVTKRTTEQRFGPAARIAILVGLLHPFDGLWEQARLLQALDLGDRGEIESASAILQSLQNKSVRITRLATLHQLRLQRRWLELVTWVQATVLDRSLAKIPRHYQCMCALSARPLS